MSLSKLASMLTLSIACLTLLPSCVDSEETDDEQFDNLRPVKPTCPNCHVSGNTVTLSLDTSYDPTQLVDVTIKLNNEYGIEQISYGTTVSVPNTPDAVRIIDNELCTVGTTGLPPSSAVVIFEFEDSSGAGTYTVSSGLEIAASC